MQEHEDTIFVNLCLDRIEKSKKVIDRIRECNELFLYLTTHMSLFKYKKFRQAVLQKINHCSHPVSINQYWQISPPLCQVFVSLLENLKEIIKNEK
jgi:hypothetical protein